MTIIHRSAQEMKDLLLDGRIERLYQLDIYTFVLAIYSRKRVYHLVVSFLKRSRRFHLVFEKIHTSHFMSSDVVRLLNKHIAQCRIAHVLLWSKAVEFVLAHDKNYRLIIDFFNSALRLVDEDRECVVCSGSIRPSDDDPLEGGKPLLRDHSDKISALSVNEALSKEFMAERSDALRRSILKIIKKEEKKIERLVEKLQAEQQEVENRDRYRQMGELIKYNLHRLSKGSDRFVLRDFSEKEVSIPANPLLSPLENMNAYFAAYKKLKKKEAALKERIASVGERLHSLRLLRERLCQKDYFHLSLPQGSFLKLFEESKMERKFLERIRDFSVSGSDVRPPRPWQEREKQKYLRFVSATGKEILVGRNARENEELTIRTARGNDLWFHLEHGAGSHVVLRYDRASGFAESDILDAAHLAIYFSKQRGQREGDVVFTHRKHINKPKNSKPGYVTYYNNKTKHILLDDAILKRLLNQGSLIQA